MSDQAPRLDPRRSADFAAELRERARGWIPGWDLTNGDGDFGRALLDIAARFSSEVAERLDGAGEKMRRGFLDWLAVRGEAARPARMPVAFKLADAARTPVLAEAPIRLQADAGGTPVVFETETDVRIVPGVVSALVAVDPANDAFYLAPPGLTDLEPLEPAPARWQPKNFVAAGATKFQLDPEGGLSEGTVFEAAGHQYRVLAVDKDLVTITPPLDTELPPETLVTKADRLAPFDGVARNWQAHALYLGDADLLNIEADATIEVLGAGALRTGASWQYWGKAEGSDEVAWQPLALSDVQPAGNSVSLKKPKGAVEAREIAGRNGRWIRAYNPTSQAAVAADEFTVRINGEMCTRPLDCPPDGEYVSPAAEGMANTTPLVLENNFLPLGREPRQFDAFYLGSKEVFSKPRARVSLCFQMADPKFAALASLRGGPFPDILLGGVGEDGHLHLLQFDPGAPRLTRFLNRTPVRPPSPDVTGAVVGGAPVNLDQPANVRPPMWLVDGAQAMLVAVTSGSTVWIWRETGQSTTRPSGWRTFGSVGDDGGAPEIAGLAQLTSGNYGHLFALRDGVLYACDLDASAPAWQEVDVTDGVAPIALAQIAPIQMEALNRGTSLATGMIGVGVDEKLYGITFSGSPLVGAATRLLDDVAADMAPAAIRRLDNRLVAIALGRQQPNRKVLAFRSQPGPQAFGLDATDDAEIVWGVDGASLDVNLTGNEVTAAFCLEPTADQSAIALWSPLFGPTKTPLYRTRIVPRDALSNGAPTLLPQHILIPTTTSEVIVAPVDIARRVQRVAPLGAVVVTASAADRLVLGDHVAYFDSAGAQLPRLEEITSTGTEVRRQAYYRFATSAAEPDLLVYKAATVPLVGETQADLSKLTLAPGDSETDDGMFLLITTDTATPKLHRVNGPVTGGVATLDPVLDVADPANPPATVDYQRPDASQAVLRPMLKLDAASTGNWDAGLLDRTQILFPGAVPRLQDGIAIEVDANRPKDVALGAFWQTLPPALPMGVAFVIDESVGNWSRQLGDTSTNPELSWEYWNGTGWWTLGEVDDTTAHLKRTGKVAFTVPVDLRESDWSGKTNFWIRARLIGGDYGQEKVTVVTKTLADNKTTEQTVQRSTDGIRPPSVLKLHISYALCDATRPTFVLAEDGGSIRDQSDANRTPGAIVETFVPLSVMLARLSGDAAAGTQRALLVGLTAPPIDAPVNILVLVDERTHGDLAPLVVQAFTADRFQDVVADDDTRALGESGVLSMAFPVAPTTRELFGRTLSWLKLTPRPATATPWQPSLRGAYLNAVWASATETLTRELLGSSDGAPFLTFRVARPPVVKDTLELRVREPLGDEERQDLVKDDSTRVLSGVEGLPGHWVRWEPVIDPGDEPANARVYSLDESIGEVRFGDGLHGMIPPIGRDSIVAFSYKRTEPGPAGSDIVPANALTARTPLSLVTPVESVEAVVAAEQAAGGAPPESVDRVVRFGVARLRHRSRVVTSRDLEDIALQSSPDIVQARAFPTRRGVKLVVVMKGRTPSPTAAQVRELRRVLLAGSALSLGAAGALRIAGPTVHPLRVDLKLRVESLDQAGALGRSVKEQLAAFFDTATGGLDRRGWQLGANPTEEDVALALIDAKHLEGIVEVALREAKEDGTVDPWPTVLPPTHLAMLAADPVRIELEAAEVLA